MEVFDQGYDLISVENLEQSEPEIFKPCMLVIKIDTNQYSIQIDRVDMFHGRDRGCDKINNNCVLSSYQPNKHEQYLVIEASNTKIMFSLGVEGLCGIEFELPREKGLILVKKIHEYMMKKCIWIPEEIDHFLGY